MEYYGAGGELIPEKNQKQKISWHCPFKGYEFFFSAAEFYGFHGCRSFGQPGIFR